MTEKKEIALDTSSEASAIQSIFKAKTFKELRSVWKALSKFQKITSATLIIIIGLSLGIGIGVLTDPIKSNAADTSTLTDNSKTIETQKDNLKQSQQVSLAQTPNVSTPIVTQSKSIEPKESKKPLTITEQLWAALDSANGTREGYKVVFKSKTGEASLIYNIPQHRFSEEHLDENALIRDSYKLFVKYGTEAFKVDGVKDLAVDYETDFIDSYGKHHWQNAIVMIMNKQEFLKYDWKELEGDSIWKQMNKSCSVYYIHPAILKNVEPDKLYLSF